MTARRNEERRSARADAAAKSQRIVRAARGGGPAHSIRQALTGDLPLSDPALIAVITAAAFAVALLLTLVIQDTDLWTLLAQGRAIAADPGTIRTNQWTWPGFGTPQIAGSWLFRVILWPLWSAGGVTAVFLWRWGSALAVFALLFAVARRMGARGPLTPLVLVACALVYRTRGDARPESLAAILLALSLWILETRRAGGADRTIWLVPIALLWSNAHVSVYLLFALIAFHLAGELWTRRGAGRDVRAPAPAARRRPLWTIGLLTLGAALIHPSGWRALWQPFEFALFWRGDPMFATIEELRPLTFAPDWRSGAPVLIALWPLTILARAVRRRFDIVESLTCALVTAAVWTSLRFAGVWAVAAAPYLARNLTELLRVAPAASPPRRWIASVAVIGVIAGLTFTEATRPERPFGVGIEMRHVPDHAATFMAEAGVRGRGFNHMQHGGYLAYRFWPDRERLPFVTTQPELSTATVRAQYIEALRRPAAWHALDRERRFDYVLLERDPTPGDHLLDVLDQDTTWVMVFADDAAELYVRREGPLADIGARHGYRVIPGGRDARVRMMNACQTDTTLRAVARAEAERMATASPANGAAHHLLGFLALMDGREHDAAQHLERTVALRPFTSAIREILGDLALEDGRRDVALSWYREERARFGANPRIDQRIRSTGARP